MDALDITWGGEGMNIILDTSHNEFSFPFKSLLQKLYELFGQHINIS